MASFLKGPICKACGQQHPFCSEESELQPRREYEYVCPTNGQKVRILTDKSGALVRACPTGSVPVKALSQNW
ncbi:hypothetical protein SAMN05421753_12098 [Planctomicrobium piriforme]|uniref:Uncharacterized protein n=1 Tax=Planctomicrobium piriforme TaxID=1576369 RepID=A0A1I3RCA3_9PLAN|nr:hypothetical protein SAMN05421753_12085 [Planctomicrobium piriforme]SFJ44362.1 hypothetical protein SAMN05421753_12098 [Planctomicrobium piriforme]